MASIENLRKQAKQIVRWHRERHYPVAQLLRRYIPRFESLTDPEILDSPLLLTEAQDLVARRAGFESWATVREGATDKDEPTARRNPSLTGAEPQLFVTDMAAAIDHYERLGFAVVFTYGEPPFYGQIQRNGVALNLRWTETSPFLPCIRESESLLAVTLLVNDVKALYLQFEAVGIEFHQRLRKEPWGARTFIVKDPDGNLILFAGS